MVKRMLMLIITTDVPPASSGLLRPFSTDVLVWTFLIELARTSYACKLRPWPRTLGLRSVHIGQILYGCCCQDFVWLRPGNSGSEASSICLSALWWEITIYPKFFNRLRINLTQWLDPCSRCRNCQFYLILSVSFLLTRLLKLDDQKALVFVLRGLHAITTSIHAMLDRRI